ncbi:MAG: hypothetical protein P8J87_14105 [Verrucomicrobiales bacterium]|nr:hypothetical protein [Verrucomicrobiales bacterium]
MITLNLKRCLVARSGGDLERASFTGACDRANVWAPVMMVLAPGKKEGCHRGGTTGCGGTGEVAERSGGVSRGRRGGGQKPASY